MSVSLQAGKHIWLRWRHGQTTPFHPESQKPLSKNTSWPHQWCTV